MTVQLHGSTLRHRSRRRQATLMMLILLTTYAGMAYLIMPEAWQSHFRHHPALDHLPGITLTKTGIPGDPVNVALVGTHDQVVKIMLLAKWSPADPITLKSSLRIAADTVFRRAYVDAPVSSLYLFHRKEDLAFEQPLGPDPKQRHHVRFWKSTKSDADGRPLWFGAATFDRGVGFSHTTGEITHHIAGDVDAERDYLIQNLNSTKDLKEVYHVTGFHKMLQGRNGGGDHWWTDGNLSVGVIKPTLNQLRQPRSATLCDNKFH